MWKENVTHTEMPKKSHEAVDPRGFTPWPQFFSELICPDLRQIIDSKYTEPDHVLPHDSVFFEQSPHCLAQRTFFLSQVP